MKITFVLIVLLYTCFAHDHPMVGMMSYSGSPSEVEAKSYIQGESAKFVESSGARNVAVLYDQDWTESQSVLEKLNGLFIQNSISGHMDQSETFKTSLKNAYEYVSQKKSAGVTFPLWTSGITALQLLEAVSGSQIEDFTEQIDASDYATSLALTEFMAQSDYTIMGNMRDAFLKPVLSSNLAYFNQTRAVTKQTFQSNAFLNENFEIAATAKDKNGVEFVAILKGKNAPVILSSVLFEKVYNFFPETNVPHSTEATRLSVQFSKSFTDLCRSNDQTYGSIEAEYVNNLYNHKLMPSVGKEYQTFYF
jgi:gamma-glutamyl hydrolase